MNLGSTIKKIRLQKKIKQNFLAKSCSITPSYLSQIESNSKEPNLSVLRAISKKLEVPLPILFFLSLEESDIKPDRRKAYGFLAPSIKSVIAEFFTHATDI